MHGGVVYIGNEAAKVYAFSADEDGTRVWSDEPGEQHDHPAVELPIADHLYNQPPSLQTENMTGTSSPAVATVDDADYLLLGCDDGYIYRITLGSSDPQSTLAGADLGYCVESSPTVVESDVYIGVSHYDGNQVYRLSVEPLQILTAINVCSPGVGQECRATLAWDGNGFLYTGVDTGSTFHKLAADPLGNAATAPFTATWYVGSVALCGNGLAYVGNDDGALRVLLTSDLSEVVPGG